MNQPLRCPRCANTNAASQKFCTNCGQELLQGSPQDPASESSIPPAQPINQAHGNPPGSEGSGFLARVMRGMNRIFSLAIRWIPRLPLYGRLAPFLGLDELTSIRPVFKLGVLGLVGLLGIYPSLYGHIDTTPFLFPIMALISSFNPALGMVAGVIFGITDFAEKMATNQIYYETSANVLDYLGARIGYIISYSAVIVAGMLPGLMSRAFRLFARRMFSGRVGPPSGTIGFIALTADSRTLEVAAGFVGGMLGGGLANAAAIPLEVPAFMLRANPDISCFNAAVGNLTRGIPTTAVAGGAGGAVSSIASGGVISSPGAPSAPASTPSSAAPSTSGVIDQKVVSGQEAIDRLIDEGLHDGDCVPVPDHWASSPSNIRGVGYTKTKPHPTDPNKRCLDPDHIAITVDWTHPPGPTKTTSIQPGENIKDRIEKIFGDPPQEIKTNGDTILVSPENLPDHVAGIGHGTDTYTDPTTGEEVVIISPGVPVVIEHWDPPPPDKPDPITIPPAYTDTGPDLDPVGPREPPEEPKPPPPKPKPPPSQPSQPKKTYVFGMKPLVGLEGGEVLVAMLLCVKVRGIYGGSGEGYLIYRGAGTGAGTPVSVWGPGSENQVIATQPMTVEQFAGGGAVGGIGGAYFDVGASFNSIIFFCGPLPNVYWVPWGWATGIGAGFSGTVGEWKFHRTATQALTEVMDAITAGAIDRYIGQKNLVGYINQIQTWILGP